MTPRRTDKDRHVGFRLGTPYSDRLERVAHEQGLSPGKYARLVLVQHFEETASHRIADKLEALENEVQELRIQQALTQRQAA